MMYSTRQKCVVEVYKCIVYIKVAKSSLPANLPKLEFLQWPPQLPVWDEIDGCTNPMCSLQPLCSRYYAHTTGDITHCILKVNHGTIHTVNLSDSSAPCSLVTSCKRFTIIINLMTIITNMVYCESAIYTIIVVSPTRCWWLLVTTQSQLCAENHYTTQTYMYS